jgi:hypothetical protein
MPLLSNCSWEAIIKAHKVDRMAVIGSERNAVEGIVSNAVEWTTALPTLYPSI